MLPFAPLLLCALATTLAAQEPAPAPVPAEPPPVKIRAVPLGGVPAPAAKPKAQEAQPVYDEKADARKDVAAALARAQKENKRVLIQWGANWCGWCKWLAGTMKTNGKLSHKILYEYEVVHVDVGRFDKHMDLAKELGAEFKSIPFLTILAADGKALVQQNTEPFETKVDGKDGHDAGKLLDWLTLHECKPLDAKAVLAAGMERATKEHKRVFLHFGAPWCGWCHKLEDWMARPEIAAVLGKDFVDLKIDNDRMTGGKEIFQSQMAAAGQKEGGIPWFVFLAADGTLVAHSTGPKGNTGFPYQPEEIEHFGTMLRAAQQNITDDEIGMLLKSLDDNRENEKKARAAR
jgi:thiol-disulfide isomerase/thioredoxin